MLNGMGILCVFCIYDTIGNDVNIVSKKRLAISLYVFLHTACFHFELLELVQVDLF